MSNKAVLFDLDNTLYPAEQYFQGALEEVAEYMCRNHNVPKRDAYEFLMVKWEQKTSMYPHLFDDVKDAYDVNCDVGELVTVFNAHEPYLQLYDGMEELLDGLRSEYVLGLVTDGTSHRQQRKVSNLGICEYFDAIVYTDILGTPKPSSKPFRVVSSKLSVRPSDCCYVGDNPEVDFAGAKKCNMETIRVYFGEFKDLPSSGYADYEATSVDQLKNVIADIF